MAADQIASFGIIISAVAILLFALMWWWGEMRKGPEIRALRLYALLPLLA